VRQTIQDGFKGSDAALTRQAGQYLTLAASIGTRCVTENETSGDGSSPVVAGPSDTTAILGQTDNEIKDLLEHGIRVKRLAVLRFLDAVIAKSRSNAPPAVFNGAGQGKPGNTGSPNTRGCTSAMHVLLLAGEDHATGQAVRYDQLAVSVAWRCGEGLASEAQLLGMIEDGVAPLAKRGTRTQPRLAELVFLDQHLASKPPLQLTAANDCGPLLHAFTGA